MIGRLRKVRAAVRSGGEYRLGRWGTFWHRFALARFRLAAGVLNFGDDGGWVLHLGPLWVRLWAAGREPKDEMHDSWGFSFDNEARALHLNWGHRTKILHYPWAAEWVRTEHGMPDGSFVTVEEAGRLPRRLGGGRKELGESGRLERVRPWKPGDRVRGLAEAPGRYRESFPYRYTLRNGAVQDRTATVTVERRTHCWRGFWLLGVWLPAFTRTSIWVEFSDEVGERSGSWKGGCVGCGYDLRPGETPGECLRRMEGERVFS